ncbi:MAG: flagellin [Verrucomicrobiota bacterium]
MSVVINTNATATMAKNNLSRSNAMLQSSLNRLSSGSKIVSPADDAGGLAVSMKLQAAIARTEAVNTNIANAQSFLQTQDGALNNAAKVLDRMSELKVLSQDVTKNTTDVANYNTEFQELQSQLDDITGEQFNGVSLFTDAGSAASLSVYVTENGTQSLDINQAALEDQVTTDLTSGSANLTATDLSDITDAIENVAVLRATNGAQSSRLTFASEMLTVNKSNLEAANSRIIDVDVAAESTRLAKANVLVQAGASMLTQANASSQTALRLIG